MNPWHRSVAPAMALGLALSWAGSGAAQEGRPDREPPIPERVHLEPIDPARLWSAIRPALAQGRCPELIRQLVGVFTDRNPNRPAAGWYRPSRRRHDWRWLAGRYDADRDGMIRPAEIGAPDRPWAWASLDRDRDGAIRPDDLDWSESSPWVRQDRLAHARFQAIDVDANGRISAKEWQRSFQAIAREKEALSIEDMRRFLEPAPDPAQTRTFSFRFRWNRAKVILNGDIGSMFEGPDLDAPAPDFLLATQDGRRRIGLPQFRGKKPVVLIFGSFT